VTRLRTLLALLLGDSVPDTLQAELPDGDETGPPDPEEAELPALARLRPHSGAVLLEEDAHLQELASGVEDRIASTATAVADAEEALDAIENDRISMFALTAGWTLRLLVAAALLVLDAATILPAAARILGVDVHDFGGEGLAHQAAVVGLVAFLLAMTLIPAHLLLTTMEKQ
jgi:hypothetical protein